MIPDRALSLGRSPNFAWLPTGGRLGFAVTVREVTPRGGEPVGAAGGSAAAAPAGAIRMLAAAKPSAVARPAIRRRSECGLLRMPMSASPSLDLSIDMGLCQ